jgi:hypothetical protein
MPDDIRADPAAVARLAAAVLEASNQLADAWRTAQGPLAIPEAAFGNSGGAAGVFQSHGANVEAADMTITRQVAVLEGDTDRLYQVAFAYQKHEEDEQANLRRAGGGTP